MKRAIILMLFLPMMMFGQDIPRHKPDSYVNDYANLISQYDEVEIDNKIRSFKKRSSIEISVVIISSLGNYSIEDYSNELFNRWGIGQADLDNGILILHSTGDRLWRIEVGDGLGPWLTDGWASTKGTQILVPNFRSGNFAAGYSQMVDEIIGKLGTTSWDGRVAANRAANTKVTALPIESNDASIASQMREEHIENQRAQSARIAEESAASFPWILGGFVLLALLGYFLYKDYQKKQAIKKAEEDRLRRIASLKQSISSYVADFRNAISKVKLQTKFRCDNLLSTMESAFSLVEGSVISQVSIENEDNLNAILIKLKAYGDVPLSNGLDLLEVVNQINSLEEYAKTFPGLCQQMKQRGHDAEQRNSGSIYRKMDWEANTVVSCVNKAEKILKEVHDKLWNNAPYDYDNFYHIKNTMLKELKTMKSEAHRQLDYAGAYIKSLDDHLAYMEKAASYVSRNRSMVGNLLSDIRRLISHIDVRMSTREMVRHVENRGSAFDRNFKVDRDVSKAYTELQHMIGELDSAVSALKRDIDDAEAERQRVERARLAAIRAEEDARRERAREQARRNEEDARQRQSSSYGDGSSYGGGKSSGGGASGGY